MKKNIIAAVIIAINLGTMLPVVAADMGNMNGMSTAQATEKVAHGVGIVKDIDTRQNTIVLAHQPIKELNWQAMTMAFKVSDGRILKGIKAGDQVSFDLKGSGMDPVVTAIRPGK
ncbi:copper-binding protein [Herbaspirillum autotrophicum]|uniref:copper-binding protein n=1 Tax=Herbaspirillum autotrophicum TaxID=180195 RepID=UPI00067D0C83|nr:copper-binding protein [Herbaspirillum autotrophicum]